MIFDIAITITLKKGVLDSQGKAVTASLQAMGYEALRDVRVGRFVEVVAEAPDLAEAQTLAGGICEDLLVHDLIEESLIEVRGR